MEKEKILWTDTEKKILKHLKNKDVRKKFYQYLIDNWHVHLLLTFHSTTGLQNLIKVTYKTQPNIGDRIILFARAFSIIVQHDSKWSMSTFEQLHFIEKLSKKYYVKLKKKYPNRLKKKLLPSPYTYTQHIKEAIERGFVHSLDLKINQQSKTYCQIGNIKMIWPHTETQDNSIENNFAFTL